MQGNQANHYAAILFQQIRLMIRQMGSFFFIQKAASGHTTGRLINTNKYFAHKCFYAKYMQISRRADIFYAKRRGDTNWLCFPVAQKETGDVSMGLKSEFLVLPLCASAKAQRTFIQHIVSYYMCKNERENVVSITLYKLPTYSMVLHIIINVQIKH